MPVVNIHKFLFDLIIVKVIIIGITIMSNIDRCILHIYIYIYVCVHMYAYAYMCSYAYICMWVYVCVCIFSISKYFTLQFFIINNC